MLGDFAIDDRASLIKFCTLNNSDKGREDSHFKEINPTATPGVREIGALGSLRTLSFLIEFKFVIV